MAVVAPRTMDVNLVKGASTVLSADSAQQSNPVRWLLDQLRSKVWRSDLGWVVIAGWNDQIIFVETEPPGPLTATITAGTYATPTEYAAAVQAALMAAPGRTRTYTVTWDSSTGKFTITASIAITDLWFSASNGGPRRAGADLGFTETDKGGAASYTAENASYQGRHYIGLDLGSAQAITSAVLLADNVSASGSVKVQSSATSILAALTAPDATQTLTDRGDLWSAYFNSQSHQYVVFLINDTTNSTGYAEAGIAFLGAYRAPSAYSANHARPKSSLSVLTNATEGALMGDQRPGTNRWALEWRNQTTANVSSIFEAWADATPEGKCFFFDFDSATPDIVYGYRIGEMAIDTRDGGLTWTVTMMFAEALP